LKNFTFGDLIFERRNYKLAHQLLTYSCLGERSRHFSRPYLSNARAFGMVVVRLSVVCLSVCNECSVAKRYVLREISHTNN